MHRPLVAEIRRLILRSAARVLPLLPAVSAANPLASAVNAELRVNVLSDEIQQSAAVAMDGAGNFVVAWQSEVAGSGDEIRARLFDARGVPVSSELAVNE